MMRALFINKSNLQIILDLNDGVCPADECFDNQDVFLYSDDENVHNKIVSSSEFFETYKFVNPGDNSNVIERI